MRPFDVPSCSLASPARPPALWKATSAWTRDLDLGQREPGPSKSLVPREFLRATWFDRSHVDERIIATYYILFLDLCACLPPHFVHRFGFSFASNRYDRMVVNNNIIVEARASDDLCVSFIVSIVDKEPDLFCPWAY
eukprot:SAG22_NODE_665_length_8020_cov_22.612296_9_plen_137_part_00